jgi:hypothetical protein
MVNLSWMIDDPIVVLLVPSCYLLILSEFLWWNKVSNNHILQLKLIGELIYGVVHVIPFPIEVIRETIELLLRLTVLMPDDLKLLGLELDLLLNTVEMMLGSQQLFLLLLELLLDFLLLHLLLLQLLLSFLELLLLLLGYLDGLRANHHLLLHLFESIDELLLLGLGLFF